MGLNSDDDRPRRRRGGCCGTGCLLLFLLLLLLVGGGAAFYYGLPQKLGLWRTPAQKLLAPQPDREAASTILRDLAQSGVNTRGMELYVLPYRDGSGAMAYAVLDGSKGFAFPSTIGDPLVQVMVALARGQAAQTYGLKRVAIEYRDQTGQSLVTMTAATKSLEAYIQGTITRQQLLQAIDGTADLKALAGEVMP